MKYPPTHTIIPSKSPRRLKAAYSPPAMSEVTIEGSVGKRRTGCINYTSMSSCALPLCSFFLPLLTSPIPQHALPLLPIVRLALLVLGECDLAPNVVIALHSNPPLVGDRTRVAQVVPVNDMVPCGNGQGTGIQFDTRVPPEDVLARIRPKSLRGQLA